MHWLQIIENEFRVKEESTRTEYIMHVFNLNDTKQNTFRVYDQNGRKYVAVIFLRRRQKGCKSSTVFIQ